MADEISATIVALLGTNLVNTLVTALITRGVTDTPRETRLAPKTSATSSN